MCERWGGRGVSVRSVCLSMSFCVGVCVYDTVCVICAGCGDVGGGGTDGFCLALCAVGWMCCNLKCVCACVRARECVYASVCQGAWGAGGKDNSASKKLSGSSIPL